MNNLSQTGFLSLTPDTILSVVEKALGIYLSNICRPMNSYINRVYELADEDGKGLIVKFYRPGRWSRQALQDEHDFLLELDREEVPVIAPLQLAGGGTLGQVDEAFFALFPKKWGRSVDEYSEEQWLELGHLLGRTHAVGAARRPKDRLKMVPDRSTRSHIDYIVSHNLVPKDLQSEFRNLTEALLDEITPMFRGIELIRLHGDCHSANLIYRPDESFYLIDFDDMVLGPPVQDMWMLLPAVPEESVTEIDLFLEGYRTFRDFDIRSLKLIEPLRAMRFIHYMAWCAHQVVEDGSSEVMPNFGSREYWLGELNDLTDQLQRIREQPENFLSFF